LGNPGLLGPQRRVDCGGLVVANQALAERPIDGPDRFIDVVLALS
jgi:hypothetical protein